MRGRAKWINSGNRKHLAKSRTSFFLWILILFHLFFTIWALIFPRNSSALSCETTQSTINGCPTNDKVCSFCIFLCGNLLLVMGFIQETDPSASINPKMNGAI